MTRPGTDASQIDVAFVSALRRRLVADRQNPAVQRFVDRCFPTKTKSKGEGVPRQCQHPVESDEEIGDAIKLTSASRNTLKQHFRSLVERGTLSQRGSGRGVWYDLR